MSIFNFLSNQALADNTSVKPAAATAASRGVQRNPTDADLRLFRNGAIYPSLALIEKDQLTYLAKEAEGDAFGYDVTDSRKFINTQGWEKAVIFISKIEKSAAKVDLFGRCTYDENGAPSDVATQGATTFGKDLLETLKEVYGYEIPEGESFVDLKIVEDFNFTTADNIYYLPKPIARGPRKGEIELARRENLKLNILMPLDLFNQEMASSDVTEAPSEVTETEEAPVAAPVQEEAPVEAIPAEVKAEDEDTETEESTEFDFTSDEA